MGPVWGKSWEAKTAGREDPGEEGDKSKGWLGEVWVSGMGL